MPGTSSSSSCDTPCCSGVGNRVTCHKGRKANQLPEPGLSRPHPMTGKRSWDPLTSLNGGSDLCRDRKTHAVGKDLRHHLVAQRRQCLGLRPTASQQQSQVCVPVLHACNLTGWLAHGSARSGRGTPEADLVSSPLHASLPDLGCMRAGPASYLKPSISQRFSPPTREAPAQGHAQCHVCGHRGHSGTTRNLSYSLPLDAYSLGAKREYREACR